MRTRNFWLILIGATLVIGAINAVIQHFIFFLIDQGYTKTEASRFLSVLLASSLGGRVLVGYIVDRFQKKNTMALFYLIIGASIPILFLAHQPLAAWSFAIAFGFAVGADYMLIPLVTAECFGIASSASSSPSSSWATPSANGRPWIAGRLFDAYHSYQLAWLVMAGAGILGALSIYAVTVPNHKKTPATQQDAIPESRVPEESRFA